MGEYQAAQKAMFDFWATMGLPVYIHGEAPRDKPLPYITFTPTLGDAFSQPDAEAFLWVKATDEASANKERAKWCDKITQRIPARGVKIAVDGGGMIVCYRHGNGTFISPYDPPEGKEVVGARIAVQVHFDNSILA